MSYVRRAQTRDGKTRFNTSLSPAAVSLIALGMLLILGWCFYMGFMIGRGQNPEEHLQRMAAMLQAGRDKQPGDNAPAAGTADASSTAAAKQGGQEAPAQSAGVSADSTRAVPRGQVPGYPVFQTGKAPAQKAQQPASPPRAQVVPAGAAAQSATPTYTFVYRMATVRSREDARSEQERYEHKGFRTSIRQSGKVWALFHTFKGTDKDCELFLEKVSRAGLGAPVRVSRKKN